MTWAFFDPSIDEHPGWPLRNLLVLCKVYFKLTTVNILSIRRPFKESRFWTVELPGDPVDLCNVLF